MNYSRNAYLNFKETPENCVRTVAQRPQVARNNTQIAKLRPALPNDNIDVQGLIFSSQDIPYNAPLEEITYDKLLELLSQGELNGKYLYLKFSPELKQYLDADNVALTYEDLIQNICSQLYKSYQILKNNLLIQWSKKNINLSILNKLSLKIPIPAECFQNVLI